MAICKEQFGGRLWIALRPGTRRWLKRMYWKRVRRLERHDVENAPIRRQYRGWYD